MRPRAVLIGDDLEKLLALMIALGPSAFAADVIEADRPVQSLLSAPISAADVAVVMLQGAENVADLRGLLEAHPRTRFVFLALEFPPVAAIARIVAERRGVVLRANDPPVVVAATLVAMLATTPAGASA